MIDASATGKPAPTPETDALRKLETVRLDFSCKRNELDWSTIPTQKESMLIEHAENLERQRNALEAALREAYDQIDCNTGDADLDAERRLLKGRMNAALSLVERGKVEIVARSMPV